MKKRIAISILLAVLAGGHSIHAETRTLPAPDPSADRVRDLEQQLRRAIGLLREQDRLLYQQRMIPRPQPPSAPGTPPWLLPLLAAAIAASTLGAALQPVLFRRTRTLLRATEVAVHDADANTEGLQELVKGSHADLAERINGARDVALEQLAVLSTDVARVRDGISRLAERPPAPSASPAPSAPSAPSAPDPIRPELLMLAQQWKRFREQKDLGEATSQDHAWDGLLNELTTLVPNDLRPSFDAVLTPYREHRQLVQKIGIIPKVVQGEMPLSSEAAELKRARDLAQLLMAVESQEGRVRLQFHVQSWIIDTFLPFADLYLQNYQKALLERRDTELQKGMTLVRQILRIASVEPVDVTLGETRFDSTRHIGRFTSSDPRFSDGVITGVVRNGFVEGGHQVIRQPEVIVNRVR